MKTLFKKTVAIIISLAVLMSMMTAFSVSAYDPAVTYDFDLMGENEVYIENPYDTYNFMFIPKYTGNYVISTNEEEIDPVVKIYDYNLDLLVDENNMSDQNKNASYLVRFEAGAVYYLETYINGDQSDFTYIIYSEPENPVESFEIVSESGKYDMYLHEHLYLHTLNILPDNAQFNGFEWYSSDESIVSVDQNGYVSAFASGTATITAVTTFGIKSSVEITVKPYVTLEAGKETKINITEYGQLELFEFIPKSSGEYIVTFNTDRNVRFKYWTLSEMSYDSYIISPEHNYLTMYLYEGVAYGIETGFEDYMEGTFSIELCKYADEISIKCDEFKVTDDKILNGVIGESAQLYVEFSPEGSKKENITWKTTDSEVVSVSENGVISFNKVGSAIIEVYSQSGRCDAITINVGLPIIDISLGDTVNVEFFEGQYTRRLKFVPQTTGLYKLMQNEDSDSYVNFFLYDENENLLSVTSDFADLSIGYYFEEGKTYYFDIILYQPNAVFPVTLTTADFVNDFRLECLNDIIYVGTRNEVRVFGTEGESPYINELFTFSVDDETVAKVEMDYNFHGSIKGLKPGTVTLTATSQTGITKTKTITVKEINVLTENVETDVNLENIPYSSAFKFVPSVDGRYEFYFENIESGNSDCYIYANLETDTEYIDSYAIPITENEFCFQEYLQAGKEYYLKISAISSAQFTLGVAKTVPLESVAINGGDESASGKQGETLNFKINTTPLHGDYEYPNWSISDESVAYIGAYNRNYIEVMLINEGECELTVRIGDITDTITIEVLGATELKLDTPAEVTLSYDSEKFKFIPETDGYYVFYSTGNADTYGCLEKDGHIASDDDNGEGNNFKITAYLYAGQTYLLQASLSYCEFGSETFNVAVTKAVPAESIDFERTDVDLNEGDYAYVNYNLGPFNSRNEELSFSFSVPDIVNVVSIENNYIVLKGLTAGTCVVTVTTASGASDSFTVNVKGIEELVVGGSGYVNLYNLWQDQKFVLNIDESDVYEFRSINNFYSVHIGIMSGESEIYSFNLDDNGSRIQVMLEAGQYIIRTGFNPDVTGSYEICVEETAVPETIILNNGEESVDCYVNMTKEIEYTLSPEFSRYDLIEWTSSDESIAIVENGIITAIGVGEAVITATLPNGYSDFITVNCVNVKSFNVGFMQTVSIDANARNDMYKVYIEETGWYLFDISSSYSTYIEIYNEYNSLEREFYGSNRISTRIYEPGIYYIVFTNYSGTEASANCLIAKAPDIESIRFMSLPNSMTHEIGTDFDYSGLVIEVVFKNGITENWTWGSGMMLGGCYDVRYWEDFDEYGNYLTSAFWIGEHSLYLQLEIVESNVIGFELYSGSIGPFYENWDCYECGDHYHYNYYRYLNDLKFIIRYNDGSYKIASYNEYVDGSVISDGGNDCKNPWTVGTNNYVKIFYKGIELKIQVEVLENPVENIVINTLPKNEFIFGDSNFGQIYDGEYSIYWEDISGLSFTVNYKDGTSKTFDSDDAVYENGSYYWDGQSGFIQTESIMSPGKYTATFSYFGFSAEFELTVNASPVVSIEIVKDPDVKVVKWEYYPTFKGMQIKVTYADSTEKIITLSDDNVEYKTSMGMGSMFIYVKDGENKIVIMYDWDEDIGEIFTVRYFDVSIAYTGIVYEMSGYEDVSIEDFNLIGGGMTVIIDGEEIALNSENLFMDNWSNTVYHHLYAETDEGLLMYSVENLLDSNGYVKECVVYILGEIIRFDVLSGDINGDGSVDVRDLVAAKKMLADMTEPENKLDADMNYDGKFDALDLPLYIKILLGVPAGKN